MSNAPARVEMPQFPGNKRLAVTTSWDDGTVHDRRLVAFLNQVGLKGTFNLNSGLFGDKPATWHQRIAAGEVAALYEGHEVAIHSVTHPFLERLDPSQIAAEVLKDRQALEDLVGYPVRGMAYPFGTYDDRVVAILRSLGIVYSRTTEVRANPWPVSEPLAWPATGHIFSGDPQPLQERFRELHERPGGRGLFYVWGHSYELEDRQDWQAMVRILVPMAGHSDVWYCTNIQLFD